MTFAESASGGMRRSFSRAKSAVAHFAISLKTETAYSAKEANAMLLSVPDNGQLMRRYRIWRGTAWTFAGILLACVATDVVYMCGDGLPQEAAVMTAASATGVCSLLCALLSGCISTSQYLKAVDNYNESLLRTARTQG
ncbi:MAG: hypothetical protein K2H09_10455 [Treponemataceae bacterium]|nr:hypothetical protein [Treponemataceae bacterium]